MTRRSPSLAATRVLALVVGVGVGAVALMPLAAVAAPSPVEIDFTDPAYTLGQSPLGQPATASPADQQWGGAPGEPNPYDVELVANADYPNSGLDPDGASLRISNTVTGSDITQGGGGSPALEVAERAGVAATGATRNSFTSSYTIASASGAYVEGLNVEVSNSWAGNRIGGIINFRHAGGMLEISTRWLPSDALDATLTSWRSQVMATTDPVVPHDIVVTTRFLEGQPSMNEFYLDGDLVALFPAWEAYYVATNGNPARQIRQVSFRTSTSGPTPDGIGYASIPAVPSDGYLFTDIGYSSAMEDWSPASLDPVAADPIFENLVSAGFSYPGVTEQVGGTTEFEDGEGGSVSFTGLPADSTLGASVESTPTYLGLFAVGPTGEVTVPVPSSLAPGMHTIAVFDLTGAVIAWKSITVLGGPPVLPPTGIDVPFLGLGVAVVAVGTGIAISVLRRRVSAAH